MGVGINVGEGRMVGLEVGGIVAVGGGVLVGNAIITSAVGIGLDLVQPVIMRSEIKKSICWILIIISKPHYETSRFIDTGGAGDGGVPKPGAVSDYSTQRE